MEGNHKRSTDNVITIASVALFILAAFGVIVFLYNQNQTLKSKLSMCSTNPNIQDETSPTPEENLPVVSSPITDSMVESPLKVSGVVPAGWMFEGVFPIKLLDSDRKVIVQSQAKEIDKGAWQSEKPVEFSATLVFKNASGSGILVLEKVNPGGDLSGNTTFEVPVNF